MKLEEYTIPRERITLPGKAVNGVKPFIEVRGLCLDDMTYIVQNHLGPLTRAMKTWQESKADIIRTGNLQQFLLTIIKDFPDLAAEVISAAADELSEAATATAKRLPLASQISALAAISRLTMEDVGGLGNLLAEMRQRFESAAESIGDQTS
jgi:hypothetical protein